MQGDVLSPQPLQLGGPSGRGKGNWSTWVAGWHTCIRSPCASSGLARTRVPTGPPLMQVEMRTHAPVSHSHSPILNRPRPVVGFCPGIRDPCFRHKQSYHWFNKMNYEACFLQPKYYKSNFFEISLTPATYTDSSSGHYIVLAFGSASL